ncbi:putative transcriptional regulator LovE [Madurella mycetomatis]|uniref:Transcriptional regulator LovE n=1 Tax=Madurella mycetomatis TaxID=100816 RepID=A0A175W176_9PEZI|nr:putative transcriptional regulator LovE [Madurella mycetomatis]
MTPAHGYQSIRSSCERCRSQKLKCTLSSGAWPEGTPPCQRCLKARVPCVFGRRLRTVKDKEHDKKASRGESTTAPTATAGSPILSKTIQEKPVTEEASNQPVTTSLDDDLIQPWTHVPSSPFTQLSQANEPSDAGRQEKDGPADFCYGGGSYLVDMSTFDADFSLTTPTATSSSIDSETDQYPSRGLPSQTVMSGCADTPAWSTGNTNVKKPEILQRLLHLVAEIHESFKLLEAGPWLGQDGSTIAPTLDNYPIGSILHLSREFAAIVDVAQAYADPSGPFEDKADTDATTGFALPPLHHRDSDAEAAAIPIDVLNGNPIDTPTCLLILNCYVSLTKLYETMLRHFQKHLSLLPSPSVCWPEAGSMSERCLNLGELPPTDAACSRIHTAIRLLLASLDRIEAAIELPDALRSTRLALQGGSGTAYWGIEPTEWDGTTASGMALDVTSEFTYSADPKKIPFFLLLRQEAIVCAGGFQDGFGELSGRAATVKELLREKMGL